MIARNRFLLAYSSILIIQRFVRKIHVKRIAYAARRNRAATGIQAQWRRFAAERYFFAALFIAMWSQSSYRGMIAREMCACLLLELKILSIQRAWRRHRTSRRNKMKRVAIIKLQMMIRCHQSRAKLRKLRREARDVQFIIEQRDKFREEALRLRREAMSPKETSSISSDSEASEVIRLKNEIAALKSKLSGLEGMHTSRPDIDRSVGTRNVFSSNTISPDHRDVARSDFNVSSSEIGSTSVVSDSSMLNRSLLDGIEEDEEEEAETLPESVLQIVSPSSTRGMADFNMDSDRRSFVSELVTPKSVLRHIIIDAPKATIVGTPFREQVSAFHRAIDNGDIELTRAILDESEFNQLLVNESNVNGKSPLHIAVARANFPLVEMLLNYGAAANCQDLDGNTPLHLSTHIDILGLLIHLGQANPNIPNNQGFCALHIAVCRLDISSIQLLLRRSADLNVADNSNWLTPLHLLTSDRDFGLFAGKDDGKRIKIANLLCSMSNAIDVNFQDRSGNSPLHNVAVLEIEEACDLLRILLENGADPNLTNARKQTPLHLLCHNDALRKVGVMQEMLYNMLYHRANPSLPSLTGCTPLHLALYHHDIDSAVQLMHRGAELHLLWNKVSTNTFLDTHSFIKRAD